MKKQYYPNVIRGGIARPLGNNFYYMSGRKHSQGGIDVGKDLEVEDGEIMQLSKDKVKVYSSVPFLNGQSPVEKLLSGEDPNKVFAQQESFKDRHNINDDGTKAQLGKRKSNWYNNWYSAREEILKNNRKQILKSLGINSIDNNIGNKIKNKYINNINNADEEIINITEYGTKGMYHKSKHKIYYDKTSTDSDKIHERTHAANADDQISLISTKQIYPKDIRNYNNYLDNAEEIYARLMEVRYDNKIDPNKKFTIDEIKELKNTSKDSHILNRYKDEDLLYLFNEIAQNNDLDKNTYMAKYGGTKKLKTQLGTDNEPNINLEEIIVTPKDWQKDFIKNFGNKELRKTIYYTINNNIYRNKEKQKQKNDQQTYVKSDYDPNVDYGKEETLKRLYDVYKQTGSPKITNEKSNLLGYRAHYNPITHTIHSNNLNNVIAELSHIVDIKDSALSNILDIPNTIRGEINRNRIKNAAKKGRTKKVIELSNNLYNHYKDPDHYENRTHSKIQPRLNDYIYSGIPTKYIKNEYKYGGKINKLNNQTNNNMKRKKAEWGLITPEEIALHRANNIVKPASNYFAAKDMNITKTRSDFTDFIQRNFPNRSTGLSNCTLTASQFYGNPIGRAATIVNNPKANNFYQVDEKYAIPGSLVIATEPNAEKHTYHSMILSGYADRDYPFEYNGIKYDIKKGEPLVHYSKGKNDPESYKKNIPLRVYNDQGDGKTFNRFYRPYDKNGLPNVLLPELIVTNKKQLGGIEYIYDKINKSNKNFAKRLRDKNRKYITNWEDTTQISTHKLGVATDNKGNHYIYPEIQEVNGQLVDYTRPPFNRTAGAINAEKTKDTIRVNSIEDGIKFTQEYKNRYMNKKQLGGKANIYRVDNNGKTNWRMNISTGEETKARKKALLGTEDPYLSINDSYRYFIDRSKFMEEWRKRNMLYANNPIGGKPDVNKLAKEMVTGFSNDIVVEKPKDIKIINSQKLKDIKLKDPKNDKPSFMTKASPYIGLTADVIGNIASSWINAKALNNMKYNSAPIPKVANKMKTTVNINPQLDQINRNFNNLNEYTVDNTSSSNVARNTMQKNNLNYLNTINKLYGDKENIETELINKDRLNQQNITNSNIDAYNTWSSGKTDFENKLLESKAENYVNSINNTANSLNNTIMNIKKDKQFNNNMIAILAANPNVSPEYIKALGADWVTQEMIDNWKKANNK